jgi:hypothetical protein
MLCSACRLVSMFAMRRLHACVGVSDVRVLLLLSPVHQVGAAESPAALFGSSISLGPPNTFRIAARSLFKLLAKKCQPGESAPPPSRCLLRFLTDCSARQVDAAPRRCDLTKFAPRSRFSWLIAPTNSGARRRFSCCAGKRATPTRSCT